MNFKETNIDYLDVDATATISSNERKWINRVQQLKAKHPSEVEILMQPEDNHGYILAHVPKKWIKINPPRQVNLSEERKRELSERLRALRLSKNKELTEEK